MRQHKILAVEDDEHIARLIKYNVEKEGYICKTVESGEEGLDAVRREKVDLVILDIMLPGMTGLEVCKSIKQDKQLSSIPIILLTAKGEEVDKIIGLESGADGTPHCPFGRNPGSLTDSRAGSRDARPAIAASADTHP